MARIAIIGLGLIGGSLGLALKAARLKDMEIVGYDDWRSARKGAEKADAVDKAYSTAREAVEGAGLVVVATPPAVVKEIFEEIAPRLAEGAAVTDVASSKQRVLEWAEEILPRNVSFVGGHPMAGKTDAGIDNAEAELFEGATYFVVPGAGASESAVQSVVGMARTVGAKPRFAKADEHDHYVAAVSHMPLMVSAGLFTMLRGSESWPDFGTAAGPAYRDLTRLASGDPQMATEIALTNREQIQHWIDRFVLELHRIRQLMDGTEEEIFREFSTAQINHTKFLSGSDLEYGQVEPASELPSSSAQLASLMVSPRIYDKVREMTKRAEEVEEPSRRRRR